MKFVRRAASLAGVVVAVVWATVGCNILPGFGSSDVCVVYATDAQGKAMACGVDAPPGGWPSSQDCKSDTERKQVNCLDACLPKADCDCVKEPNGKGCDVAMKPYDDCAALCSPCAANERALREAQTSCGFTAPPRGGIQALCADADAKRATCLEGCLTAMGCECGNPADPGCAASELRYAECVAGC